MEKPIATNIEDVEKFVAMVRAKNCNRVLGYILFDFP
jgi:predicted dehydrogenase